MYHILLYLLLPLYSLGSECNVDENTCGQVGDGSADGNLPCPTDCSKFIMCSNGIPHISNCPGGLFYNYAKDKCNWPHEIPEDSECLQGGSSTTTESQTTTETPNENCWPAPCPDGSDHGISGYEGKDCTLYQVCNLNQTCSRACATGLIFDPRPGELTCKLPTELPFRCLDENIPWLNYDEQHERMKHARVVKDPSNMNKAECEYTETCTFAYIPNMRDLAASHAFMDSKGFKWGCGNEFRLCFNGWDCEMRCDEGLRFDPIDGNCKEKSFLGC